MRSGTWRCTGDRVHRRWWCVGDGGDGNEARTRALLAFDVFVCAVDVMCVRVVTFMFTLSAESHAYDAPHPHVPGSLCTKCGYRTACHVHSEVCVCRCLRAFFWCCPCVRTSVICVRKVSLRTEFRAAYCVTVYERAVRPRQHMWSKRAYAFWGSSGRIICRCRLIGM